MTDEANKIRDELLKLAQSHGVNSLRQLALRTGITNQNLYSNITGTYDCSIKRMFKMANVLGCDVMEIIKVFHPDLYEENQGIVLEKKLPVEGK